MKKIKLSRGKFALVDDKDFRKLNKFSWWLSSHGYANRIVRANGTQKVQYMHRVIMNTPKSKETDHIDGDRLNNRRSNLRICTHAQNMMNRAINKNNRLGIRGVYINTSTSSGKTRKYIRVTINKNGKQINIGNFNTIEEAVKTYNEAAKKYHGRFARLNT